MADDALYERITTETGAVLEVWDNIDVWTQNPMGVMLRLSMNDPNDRRKAEVLLDRAAQEALGQVLLDNLKEL